MGLFCGRIISVCVMFSVCAVSVSGETDFARRGAEAAKEYRLLEREMTQSPQTHAGIFDEAARRAQAFNQAATILPSDRDPLDVVVRRSRALYDDLKGQTSTLADAGRRLSALEERARETPVTEKAQRYAHFENAVALRREIAFANPILQAITKILFITREALPPNELDWGVHMCDQYFGFHATSHGLTRENGLYVLENPWSDAPTVRNLLLNSVIESGARKGKKLGNGGYLSPDVSYDGKQILFAYTDGLPQIRVWNENTVFHLFKCHADGSGLVQLTDGKVNDFDPCWLPNGRIVFISERRGGYGRCHRREVPTFTLHSMFEDGSDIVCLSHHETNEWQPSVDNNGMVVYTRWDYVDRGFNQAHHPWITYPDGRDPRELNGNTHLSERTAPHLVADVRAIPGSSKYVAISAGHHTENHGSVIIIDPSVADDGEMSQIKRVTPDQLLSETEYYSWNNLAKGSGAYATPWPLSEKYYLCVYDGDANAQYGDMEWRQRRYAVTLMDAFGNKIPIYTHPLISCLSPMPLHARTKPPVLSHGTLVGLPRMPNGEKPQVMPKDALPKLATVGLVNVYNTRRPFPEGTKIKALRIWQVLPKVMPIVGNPRLGVCDQLCGRQCLGTVPVEEDGSAYFEVPVGVPVLFHALDDKGVAVQGMRSATYTAPGERLMCNGCHEQRVGAAQSVQSSAPLAMRRAPSVIRPEVDGACPYSYPRLVQPVLEAKCVSCHGDTRKEKMPDLRKGEWQKNPFRFYNSFFGLVPYVHYYSNAYRGKEWWKLGVQRDAFVQPYTEPGKFGALASPLYAMLSKGHHDVKLTDEEMRRLVIFMESNAAYFGHDHDTDAQAEGKIVSPVLQ